MPFVYYGGKKGLARYYPPPAYNTIIEPFAGSAGYALHWWRPGVRVVLVEKDPAVVGLWRRLQAPDAADDLRAVVCPPVGERISDALVLLGQGGQCGQGGQGGNQKAEAQVPLASLIAGGASQMQTAFAGRAFAVTSRMARDWPSHQARLIRSLPTIRDWEVIEGDYTDAPDVRGSWFIDPPYYVPPDRPCTNGDGYRMGASQIDFDHLAGWCRERKGQVVVCEQEGATWLPFRPFREMTTANGDGQRRTEVIWSRTPGRAIGTDQASARSDDARARRSARQNRRAE